MKAIVSDILQQFFRRYPAHSYLIAYSGGLDSHVLLHACAALNSVIPGLNLRAVHTDHGLQPESALWVQHCQQVCVDLSVPLQVVRLGLTPVAGQSGEAVAREARYQAFSEHLLIDEILLTAHHQDDQAETLLLNLLRGAGSVGLAAMPERRVFAQTTLGRPLLGLSKQALTAYAQQHGLQWIEDPSNQLTTFDRNYLRHDILPSLQQRWPAVQQTLARAAQWQAESHDLLSGLLQQQLCGLAGSQTGTLSVSGLLCCELNLQKALLRQWLRTLGFRMPSAKKLEHVLHDVLQAKADAKPCVSWTGCEIRRYRDDVYALRPVSAADPERVFPWPDLRQSLVIPELNMTLDHAVLADLQPLLTQARVTVRVRKGGEKLLMPSGHHVRLKKFLQDKQVPPWQRLRIPLVFADKQLIVVPGYYRIKQQHLIDG